MIFFTIIENSKNNGKLKRLYNNYSDMMYNEAYRIVKERQLAEDSVHDSFVNIKNHLDTIEEDNPCKTAAFLAIVCRNAAKRIYNKRLPLNTSGDYIGLIPNEIADNIANPPDILVNNDIMGGIYKAIDKLEEKYRDVFLLKHVYNCSRKDISELLGINDETIKKRLSRAKAMIIEQLKKEGYYED